MRPANIITAIADILAGVAISGFLGAEVANYLDHLLPMICLFLATIGLYGGGVVFNDVIDAELDRIERPERPIPSGIISRPQAIVLGSYLFLVGGLAAFSVGKSTGFIALAIMILALVYNKWGKHHNWGIVNMGLCRGLNLLMGISVVPSVLSGFWWLGLIPVVYIAAVTAISKGEVHGGKPLTLRISAVCYALVCGIILVLAVMNKHIWGTVPFIALFAFMIYQPLFKAMKEPSAPNIGKAVKGGIIALIAMNAAWVAAFSTLPHALLVLILLPLSLALARMFAVT
ncbi:UbiA-like protein EboC [Chitinophaga sp. ysch24]|uniref:UbiA-like protein EboC n=2 Tax=Chitinophaga tropicalis TaxID=2683588 RepID=A0A7K1U5X7_9BACT|nr:UbiA-like protein EboC [Chitinophaga tropicalis]